MVDGLRGELFHMILYSMAWVLIGEQVFNFRDYAVGAGVILVVVVWLALYSNKLYEIEDKLPPEGPVSERKGMRRDQLFAWILFLEGVAILVTWVLLLNWGYSSWMISLCGLVAAVGFWLIKTHHLIDHEANLLVAYGCAAGSAIDGIGVVVGTRHWIRG